MVINVIDEVEKWVDVGVLIIIVRVGHVKAGHYGVRDGSRDTNAGLFWTRAATALSGLFHMAFQSSRAWRKVFGYGFLCEMWCTTEEASADSCKQR
jgi:hypothetical protein